MGGVIGLQAIMGNMVKAVCKWRSVYMTYEQIYQHRQEVALVDFAREDVLCCYFVYFEHCGVEYRWNQSFNVSS